MKARKGTIKQPKFLISYFVSALILLLIFGLIGACIAMTGYSEYEMEVATDKYTFLSDQDLDSGIYSYFTEALNKEDISSEELVNLKWYLTDLYSETGQNMRINAYHIKKGEAGLALSNQLAFWMDTSKTAFLMYVDEDKNMHTLSLADSKYLNAFDTPEVEAYYYYDSFSRTFIPKPKLTFICKEFYADLENSRFIPTEVEIMKSSVHGARDAQHTGVTISIDPGNTEGYTLIKPKKTEIFSFDEEKQHDVLQQYGEIAGCDDIDNADWIDYSKGILTNDHLFADYQITDLKTRSFSEVYRDELINGTAILILAAFIFAFIPAVISYNIKMRRYQIFEYRRQMIDAMAHDLKTPMAAISAYAENLSGHIGSDKQEYYAGKIEEKISEMNGMVNSILDFSRSENSSVKINNEKVDLGALIAKVISDNEHTVSERSLKINYEQKPVTVKCDADLMKQALANLIGNAVIHCKEGTSIDISCDNKIVLIINTVDEQIENIKELRQPFAKGSSTRGNKGTGLGLAIADNNLAMLGFKLDIKTEGDKFIATVKM